VQLHWNGGGVLAEVDLRGREHSRAAVEAAAAPWVSFRPWQLVALEARRSRPAPSR
jgi:hypothetical protein